MDYSNNARHHVYKSFVGRRTKDEIEHRRTELVRQKSQNDDTEDFQYDMVSVPVVLPASKDRTYRVSDMAIEQCHQVPSTSSNNLQDAKVSQSHDVNLFATLPKEDNRLSLSNSPFSTEKRACYNSSDDSSLFLSPTNHFQISNDIAAEDANLFKQQDHSHTDSLFTAEDLIFLDSLLDKTIHDYSHIRDENGVPTSSDTVIEIQGVPDFRSCSTTELPCLETIMNNAGVSEFRLNKWFASAVTFLEAEIMSGASSIDDIFGNVELQTPTVYIKDERSLEQNQKSHCATISEASQDVPCCNQITNQAKPEDNKQLYQDELDENIDQVCKNKTNEIIDTSSADVATGTGINSKNLQKTNKKFEGTSSTLQIKKRKRGSISESEGNLSKEKRRRLSNISKIKQSYKHSRGVLTRQMNKNRLITRNRSLQLNISLNCNNNADSTYKRTCNDEKTKNNVLLENQNASKKLQATSELRRNTLNKGQLSNSSKINIRNCASKQLLSPSNEYFKSISPKDEKVTTDILERKNRFSCHERISTGKPARSNLEKLAMYKPVFLFPTKSGIERCTTVKQLQSNYASNLLETQNSTQNSNIQKKKTPIYKNKMSLKNKHHESLKICSNQKKETDFKSANLMSKKVRFALPGLKDNLVKDKCNNITLENRGNYIQSNLFSEKPMVNAEASFHRSEDTNPTCKIADNKLRMHSLQTASQLRSIREHENVSKSNYKCYELLKKRRIQMLREKHMDLKTWIQNHHLNSLKEAHELGNHNDFLPTTTKKHLKNSDCISGNISYSADLNQTSNQQTGDIDQEDFRFPSVLKAEAILLKETKNLVSPRLLTLQINEDLVEQKDNHLEPVRESLKRYELKEEILQQNNASTLNRPKLEHLEDLDYKKRLEKLKKLTGYDRHKKLINEDTSKCESSFKGKDGNKAHESVHVNDDKSLPYNIAVPRDISDPDIYKDISLQVINKRYTPDELEQKQMSENQVSSPLPPELKTQKGENDKDKEEKKMSYILTLDNDQKDLTYSSSNGSLGYNDDFKHVSELQAENFQKLNWECENAQSWDVENLSDLKESAEENFCNAYMILKELKTVEQSMSEHTDIPKADFNELDTLYDPKKLAEETAILSLKNRQAEEYFRNKFKASQLCNENGLIQNHTLNKECHINSEHKKLIQLFL